MLGRHSSGCTLVTRAPEGFGAGGRQRRQRAVELRIRSMCRRRTSTLRAAIRHTVTVTTVRECSSARCLSTGPVSCASRDWPPSAPSASTMPPTAQRRTIRSCRRAHGTRDHAASRASRPASRRGNRPGKAADPSATAGRPSGSRSRFPIRDAFASRYAARNVVTERTGSTSSPSASVRLAAFRAAWVCRVSPLREPPAMLRGGLTAHLELDRTRGIYSARNLASAPGPCCSCIAPVARHAVLWLRYAGAAG
jgi:hypothetical protein